MNTRISSTLLLLALLTLVFPATPHADSSKSKFKDPETGEFDVSMWLEGRAGFLPVPIIITEPAVGFGVGLFLNFFHSRKDSLKWDRAPDGAMDVAKDFIPPSVTGGGGFVTENGTWGGGVYHQGYWRQDTHRYSGALFRTKVNLTFYGFGDAEGEIDDGLEYTLDGWLLFQKLITRIKRSNFFAGAKYTYSDLNGSFDVEDVIPGVTDEEFKARTSLFGVTAEYDGRDNTMTPNNGIRTQFDIDFSREFIGSDFDYTIYQLDGYGFKPAHSRVVVGLRLNWQMATGDVPFWALPFIKLRGIPAMRYQGNYVWFWDTEVRWNVHGRWSVDGFFGGGRAMMSLDEFTETRPNFAGGAGFRYLIARLYGMQAGIDVARGPDEWAVYIVGGTWWR
jgi:hypothetical protein